MKAHMLLINLLVATSKAMEDYATCKPPEVKKIVDRNGKDFLLKLPPEEYFDAFWSNYDRKIYNPRCIAYARRYASPICRKWSNHRQASCDLVLDKVRIECTGTLPFQQSFDCGSITKEILMFSPNLDVLVKPEKIESLLTAFLQKSCPEDKAVCLLVRDYMCRKGIIEKSFEIAYAMCPAFYMAIEFQQRIGCQTDCFANFGDVRNFVEEAIKNSSYFRGFAETWFRTKWIVSGDFSLSQSGCSDVDENTQNVICQALFWICELMKGKQSLGLYNTRDRWAVLEAGNIFTDEEYEIWQSETRGFANICKEREEVLSKRKPKGLGFWIYVIIGAAVGILILLAVAAFFILRRRRQKLAQNAKEPALSAQNVPKSDPAASQEKKAEPESKDAPK